MNQQGDIFLFQTNDDGNINVEGGIVEMNGGLETAAYLSLFGGNFDDSGDQDSKSQWWGNYIEDEKNRKYRSRTQNLLKSLPATSSNLRRIEEAAKLDLEWLTETGTATSIEITATVPKLNAINIEININAIGEETTINFLENWKAST